MSKFKGIFKSVTNLLGLGAPKMPALPVPEVAAAPAPANRDDTGSTVVVGTDAVRGTDRIGNSKKRKVGDVLGGLGQSSGLNL